MNDSTTEDFGPTRGPPGDGGRNNLLDLVEELGDLSADQQRSRLDQAGLSEEERRQVEEWLGAAPVVSQFLRSPPAALQGLASAFPQIDGYEITDRLGEGGMGVVWKATQHGTHRPVALKLMSAASLGSERARARFQREVDLTAKLEHPNIARVYDGGEFRGICFYAMELIDGLPLDQHVQQEKLSRRQILELMKTICDAVQYAHQKGIIHRDLKPANILVDKAGQPRVLDFGLAKSFQEHDHQMLSMEGGAAGTPAYMSPEQAGGHLEQLDTRSDVYTLGVILFHLLSGQFPHDHSGSVPQVLRRISEQEPKRLKQVNPKVDRDLEALVGMALAHEPQRRYETAGGLAGDLHRYLNGEPLVARAPTLRYILAKKIRKHRVPLAVVLAICALVLGFSVRAYRVQHVHEMARRFDLGLESQDFSPKQVQALEMLLADWERNSRDDAATARARLYRAIATDADARMHRPYLQPADIEQIREELAVLKLRDSALSATAEASFLSRLRAWEPIVELKRPYAEMDKGPFAGLFAPPSHDEHVISFVPPKNWRGAVSLMALPISVGLHPRATMTLDESWEKYSGPVGLGFVGPPRKGGLTEVHDAAGYVFTLIVHSAGDASYSTISMDEARSKGGSVEISISRAGKDLRERHFSLEQFPTGPLRLSALREGNRITFQANELAPLEVIETFPAAAIDAANLGLILQAGDRLEELAVFQQLQPRVPSPLEKSDALFARGAYSEALEEFRASAATGTQPEARQEAVFKQALCLEKLQRLQEEIGLLEPLLNEPGEHWPAAAGCQLWFIYDQQDRQQDAAIVFDLLHTRYPIERLAAVCSNEMRVALSQRYQNSTQRSSMIRRPTPQEISGLRELQQQAQLLGTPTGDQVITGLYLARAYEAADDFESALRVLDRMLGAPEYRGHEVIGRLLNDYCCLMQVRHASDQALKRLDECVKTNNDVDHNNHLFVCRALLYHDLKRFDEAERELNRLMARKDLNISEMSRVSLMLGYIRQDRGDPAGAKKIWKAGFERARTIHDQTVGLEQRGCLVALACLSEVEIRDLQAIVDQVVTELSNTPNLAILHRGTLTIPAPVIRSAFVDPRGQNLARHLAFNTLPPPQLARQAFELGLEYLLRNGSAFDSESLDQSALFQHVAGTGAHLYIDNRFSSAQLLQFAISWKGNTGLLGWKGVSPSLDPSIRPGLTYVMGKRFMKLGKSDVARDLFSQAPAAAGDDAVLARLAKAELRAGEKTEAK